MSDDVFFGKRGISVKVFNGNISGALTQLKRKVNAEGINRARSATEAFLYQRLETLPETAGRFHLNALLSIPFDISSQMEVDLLCADARLAVELDGAQHLADANAYRRDRRKDALLQQNGYLVLRFLSEDVGKHLDDVLDSILRALTHQSAFQEGKIGQKLENARKRL